MIPVPEPTLPRGHLGTLALSRAELDRSAHLRTAPDELAAHWEDPRTTVLMLHPGGRFAISGEPPVLVLEPVGATPVERRLFLGLDADGAAYFAALPADPVAAPADGLSTLRETGALLGARDAGLAVNAVALAHWHAVHTHCPRCGAPTEPTDGGHVRRCPQDGSLHYPRTDAAVIMAILDGQDRLLLGRQAAWPPGRFSTLAGFVEPGESLEQAVRREVWEEVGVVVGELDYLGSQAWPFPASLMLGFTGRALSTELRVDGTEIEQARWLSRSELSAAVAEGSLGLPPAVSIARRLIEHWYGSEIGDEGTWR